MNFPLFDMVLAETEGSTVVDKNELCDLVRKLDEEGSELIYALMKCYAYRFHNDDSSPPFQAKKCKGGYKFEVSNLPDRLIRILHHFALKHYQKIQEERSRTAPTPLV